MSLITTTLALQAGAAATAFDCSTIRNATSVATQTGAACSCEARLVHQITAAVAASPAVARGNYPPVFALGGDPMLALVTVTVINPDGTFYGGIAPDTVAYILALPDRSDVLVAHDVVIPPLLELVSDSDHDRFPVYWLLERVFSLPQLAEAVEPLRLKVAATQDISLLSDEEREIARHLNGLYNTDYDQLTQTFGTNLSPGTLATDFGVELPSS